MPLNTKWKPHKNFKMMVTKKKKKIKKVINKKNRKKRLMLPLKRPRPPMKLLLMLKIQPTKLKEWNLEEMVLVLRNHMSRMLRTLRHLASRSNRIH